jgi:hypothetical protein
MLLLLPVGEDLQHPLVVARAAAVLGRGGSRSVDAQRQGQPLVGLPLGSAS